MVASTQPELSCFQGSEKAVSDLRERLCASERLTLARAKQIVGDLIAASESSWRTAVYDGYQFYCQGIF